MAKISPCFKKIFIFFNALFAILGVILFSFGLYLHQFANVENGMYAVVGLYVVGSVMFIIAVLGAVGAYKESKCTLIVFFTLMCLATAGTLRVAIPVAIRQQEMLSGVREYFRNMLPLTEEKKDVFGAIQEFFHCCGLVNGYKDWQDEVPESCNCEDGSDSCETISKKDEFLNLLRMAERETRKVWSKPCEPILSHYIEKILNIFVGVFFGLALLAILGGLLSLAMIVYINAPPSFQMPSIPLPYQPPKYTQVVNY